MVRMVRYGNLGLENTVSFSSRRYPISVLGKRFLSVEDDEFFFTLVVEDFVCLKVVL